MPHTIFENVLVVTVSRVTSQINRSSKVTDVATATPIGRYGIILTGIVKIIAYISATVGRAMIVSYSKTTNILRNINTYDSSPVI